MDVLWVPVSVDKDVSITFDFVKIPLSEKVLEFAVGLGQYHVNHIISSSFFVPNISELKLLSNTRAWWLTPVIPALWEAEEGVLLEIRSSRPAWPTQ